MSEEGTFKRKIIMMLNFMRTQIDLSEMIRFCFMFLYNVLASFVHLDLNKRILSDLSIFSWCFTYAEKAKTIYYYRTNANIHSI